MALTQHATRSRPVTGVRRVLTALIAAVTICGAAACTGEPEPVETTLRIETALPAETQAALQEAVEHAIATGGATGALVGVWVPWSGEWVAGVGTTSPGGASVTADMSFRAAHVTRMMTCDALYGLAKDGIVSRDDQVGKYIAGSRDLEGITLQQLCDSTSGLGSSAAVVRPSWYITPEREWAPKEIAMYGRSSQNFEPGAAHLDSDAGYYLLGLALERASHLTADELFQKYSFEPLGLTNTTLPSATPATPTPAPYLPGYFTPLDAEGARNCAEPVDISKISASLGFTEAGATSTIRDLGSYVQADAAQALPWQETDDASQQRFQRNLPGWVDAPTWVQAGGGAYAIGPLIGQWGAVPGYSTAAFSDPATGFTVVVVLNNSESGSAYSFALAMELASIASKAAPSAGQTAPEFGLPFDGATYRAELTATAICPLPEAAVEAPPAEEAPAEQAPAEEGATDEG